MPKAAAPRVTKHPRRKRKVSDSEDEDNVEVEAFPKWKMAMVIAVVFVCMLALWPTLLGPLVNMVTGKNIQQTDTTRQRQPPIHPALNRQGAAAGPAGSGQRAHMHPAAMRMQGEAAAQQTTPGRGGMFSYLLPVYTIGVMVFLVYTLSKIMFKKEKTKRKRNYDSNMSESEGSGDEGEGNMGRTQLKALQKRLFETETAMNKILEQLEDISHQKGENNGDKLDSLSAEQIKTVEETLKQRTALSKVYKQLKSELNGSSDDEDFEEDDASELNSDPSSLDVSDDELEEQLKLLEAAQKAEVAIKKEVKEEETREVSNDKPIEKEMKALKLEEHPSPVATTEQKNQSKPKVRRRKRCD